MISAFLRRLAHSNGRAQGSSSGKANRLEVFILTFDERVSIDQALDCWQIARDGCADHGPDIYAASPRPRLKLLTLERFWLGHAGDFRFCVRHNERFLVQLKSAPQHMSHPLSFLMPAPFSRLEHAMAAYVGDIMACR